jgi:invasion protein IalB
MDVVAKAILNVLAVLSLVALARSISRRDPALSEERTRSRHQSLIASLHTRGAAPFASFTTTPSHVIFTKVLPEWRNWQTQQTQSQRCSIAQNYSPIYKRKRGLSCGLNKKAQVFSRLLIPTHGVVTDKLKTKAGRRAVQGRTTSLTHKAEVSRHASSA